MSQIIVKKPSENELKSLGVERWSSWNCKKSTFDWTYGEDETCYFQEGRVKVKTPDGTVEVRKGDLATFPKGLKCTWEVIEPIRKVYTFNLVRKDVGV